MPSITDIAVAVPLVLTSVGYAFQSRSVWVLAKQAAHEGEDVSVGMDALRFRLNLKITDPSRSSHEED